MANNIDALRKKAGLTVQELADRAGISRGYLNELKRGTKRLNEDTLNSLSKALGCRRRDLLGDEDSVDESFVVLEIPVVAIVPGGPWNVTEDHAIDSIPFIAHRPGNYKGVVIRGRSVNRLADDGHIVVVDLNQNDPDQLAGKPVIVECCGEVTCKIYRRNPDRFEPYSDDPSYQTIFPSGECKIIGRVVGVHVPIPEVLR